MKLKNRYPNASDFLLGFIESMALGFTDEDVVEGHLMSCYEFEREGKYLRKINEEIDALILNIDANLPDLIENTQRYFYNSSEAVAWLKMIRILLEKPSYNDVFLIE